MQHAKFQAKRPDSTYIGANHRITGIIRALEFADFFEVSLDYLFGRSGVRYDLSILNRPIHRNKTIGDLVMLVNAMPENKQSLLYKMALSIERIPDAELK